MLLALFAWLHGAHFSLYQSILKFWMTQPMYVFLDWGGVTASIGCWQQGVDVYAGVPCDVMGRIFNYSPLWLRLDFIPTDAAAVAPVGFAFATLFILSLGLLPRPRARRDRLLVLLGTFSSLPVYAVERGNVDLIIFIVCVALAYSLAHGFVFRIVGYLLVLLAGSLKFYPFVLLLLLMRERLWRAILLGAFALVAIAAFGWWYHAELARAFARVPWTYVAGDSWGMINLPTGLAKGLQSGLAARLAPGATVDVKLLTHLFEALFGLGAVAVSVLVARRSGLARAVATMPVQPRIFLSIGTILVCGCFFAGQSIGYRGIYLLFVLPCLLALARDAADPGTCRILAMTGASVIFLLWMLSAQQIVAGLFGGRANPVSGIAGYLFWVLRELVWWGVISVLLALLWRVVLLSRCWQDTIALFARIAKAND